MGFFPTSPGDGDEIGPNANGTYFKYVAVDDKWIILNNLIISDVIYDEGTWQANMDGATKNAIRDKIELDNANATRHHTATVAGDLLHNSLGGLNADASYEHITQTQKDALHTDVIVSVANVQAVSINNVSEDSTPQLGGDLDLNGKTINCNGNLGSDHTFEGMVIDNITNAQAFGKLVYITSAHTTALCDKDSIVLAIGISVGTGEVLFSGTIRDDSFSGLAAGNPVYVGDDGNPTDDISGYATGDMVQCIGVAIDTNVILIKDICWVEIV